MTAIIEGLLFIAIGLIVIFLIVKAIHVILGDNNAD
jgi:hypothetical protein